MNSKFLAIAVISLAALSGTSAFAASSSQYAEPAEFARTGMTSSSLTRAQVQADYLVARKSGKLAVGGEADVNPAKDSIGTLSRAQVASETMSLGQAQKNLYSNSM